MDMFYEARKKVLINSLKRLFIKILLIQGVLSLIFLLPFLLFLNPLLVFEDDEESIKNLVEQKELLNSPYGWAVFGPFNAIAIKSINGSIEKIIKNDYELKYYE